MKNTEPRGKCLHRASITIFNPLTAMMTIEIRVSTPTNNRSNRCGYLTYYRVVN